MSEYNINTYQSQPRLSTDQEPQTSQALDWKQQKEVWKQIIDRYHYRHYKTRRIPSSC